MKLARIAGVVVVAALVLALAGCKWTSHSWLMPVASYDDPPPVPVGTYVQNPQGSATQIISAVPETTRVLRVTVHPVAGDGPDTVYHTGYDQIDGAYYLVEVNNSEQGRVFLILRTRANGYDYWQPACAANLDGPIALAAGAVLETSPNDANSNDCVFTSYPSLLQAARGIVTSIQSGTYAGQMTSFNRS